MSRERRETGFEAVHFVPRRNDDRDCRIGNRGAVRFNRGRATETRKKAPQQDKRCGALKDQQDNER